MEENKVTNSDEADQKAQEIAKPVTPTKIKLDATPVAKVELMDFDTWFSKRQSDIPMHHHKEIIKADFKARKMADMATMEEFDKALRRYGVKL